MYRFISISQMFAVSVLAALSFGSIASAQTFVNGNPSNRIVSIPLSAEMAGSKIIVTVVGAGPDATNLSVALQGPAGVKLSVKSMTVRSAAAAESSYSRYAIPTKIYGQFSATSPSAARSSTAPIPTVVRAAAADDRDPLCGCRTEAEINALLSIITGFTRQLLCGVYPPQVSCDSTSGIGSGGSGGNGSVDPTVGGQSGYVSAFIESNRCMSGGKPAAAIELDLSGVAAADLAGTITIRTKMATFSGNRRASIKPRSDGGIFPGQALLLAGPVGGSDAGIRLAKFSGNRRTSLQSLAVPSNGAYIYYRGNSYWRRPISKYLRGGKGTFYVSGQGQGYPLCVSLTRTRQNLNGYTN